MEKLVYGKENQIIFSSEKEKYEAIGYLCSSENCNIYIEDNEKRGSYTDAYRIKLKKNNIPIKALENATRDDNRINCNEFIEELIQRFGFVNTDGKHIKRHYQDVLEKIPEEFIESFKKGYDL
jgi:hypothetical protein